MSLFPGPEEHAANPPSTWQVVKRHDRQWLIVAGSTPIDGHPTKRAALAAIESGAVRDLYDKETRWYAGELIPGWRLWADVKNDAITKTIAAARRQSEGEPWPT